MFSVCRLEKHGQIGLSQPMATYRRNSISRPNSYVQDSSASIRSTALFEMKTSLLRGPASDQQQGEQPLKRNTNRKTGYSGAYNSIIIAVTTITIPLLAFTGVLLYLVLHHRFEQNPAWPNLQLSTDRLGSSAYYVDFSATKLTTIASWMSSIAALLPGCIMTILSHHLAKMYKQQSENGDFDALPTPYQLALLIETFHDKLTSLWNGLTYCLWKRRANLNILLRLAFPFLVISLLLR